MKKIAKSLFKSFIPSRWVQYHSGSDRTVCLTFDDGPHPNTEMILSILGKFQVKASFFLSGCQVKKYPELAKQISIAGHFMGNHFFDHVSVNNLDAEKVRRQVEDTEIIVRDTTGSAIRAVRPPYGDWNLSFFWYAVTSGRKVIFWSLDSEDGDPENSTLQSIEERCKPLRGGDIVLMHEDNPHTLEALPNIIRSAQARGLTFTTVGN